MFANTGRFTASNSNFRVSATFKDSVLHNDGDAPALSVISHDGVPHLRIWAQDGKVYRDDGPSILLVESFSGGFGEGKSYTFDQANAPTLDSRRTLRNGDEVPVFLCELLDGETVLNPLLWIEDAEPTRVDGFVYAEN